MYEAQKEAKGYIANMVGILQRLNDAVDAETTQLHAEEIADSLDGLRIVVTNIAASIIEKAPTPVQSAEGGECIIQLQRLLRAYTAFKQRVDLAEDLIRDNEWTPEEYATLTKLAKLTEDKLNFTRETGPEVMLNYIKSKLGDVNA